MGTTNVFSVPARLKCALRDGGHVLVLEGRHPAAARLEGAVRTALEVADVPRAGAHHEVQRRARARGPNLVPSPFSIEGGKKSRQKVPYTLF